MRTTKLSFLADACEGRLFGAAGAEVSDVKIDSREVFPGCLFVAVKGPNNDGHRYLSQAYEKGCRCFLVSDGKAAEDAFQCKDDASWVLTDDTQYAFEMMAKAYMDQFDLIKIGVTGSTGKTSTKALVAAVMSARFNTVCSRKNYNTHLGIAMTCFLADEDTQAIVIEMGMDRKDELYDYCKWVRPHAAVITNVGVVHMEYIGSREGIAEEKLKITSFLEPDQPLIYNCDSPFLSREEILKRSSGRFRMVPCGEVDEAVVKISGAEDLGASGIRFDLSYEGKEQRFELPFLGLHNAHNGALAAAVGLQFGISLEEAAKAMPKAMIEGQRLEIVPIGEATLIDDSYNANPDSMASAMRTLARLDAKRRIAVIADMRELGDAAVECHVGIGKLASELGIDILLAIGSFRGYYAEGCRGSEKPQVNCFETWEEAEEHLLPLIASGDAILVKGSLSTGIHCLAERLREKYSRQPEG